MEFHPEKSGAFSGTENLLFSGTFKTNVLKCSIPRGPAFKRDSQDLYISYTLSNYASNRNKSKEMGKFPGSHYT